MTVRTLTVAADPSPGGLPPYSGGLPAGAMATAQSQFPTTEMPQMQKEESSETQQGWGSIFSWGKKSKESLDTDAYVAYPKEL